MAGMRDIWVRTALLLSLGLPVYFLVAAFGTKYGLFDWTVGFGQLTIQYGPPIIMGVCGFALIGFVLALFVSPRRGILTAFVAWLIPAAGLGYGAHLRNAAADIPPIHDISTDLVNPPAFSPAVADARAAIPQANTIVFSDQRIPQGPRWGDLAGKTNAEVQATAYADIRSRQIADAPDRAFDIALAAAQAQGWTITGMDRDAGRIEATATSFFFGFTDDIVIRISPGQTGGSVIDIRSSSRVGVSDLGANAKRIRAYLAALIPQ